MVANDLLRHKLFTAEMNELPKDGTPILAYVLTRRLKGWMVVAYNGYHWWTIPGKYGVDRIVRWAPLPPTMDLDAERVDMPSGDGKKP